MFKIRWYFRGEYAEKFYCENVEKFLTVLILISFCAVSLRDRKCYSLPFSQEREIWYFFYTSTVYLKAVYGSKCEFLFHFWLKAILFGTIIAHGM